MYNKYGPDNTQTIMVSKKRINIIEVPDNDISEGVSHKYLYITSMTVGADGRGHHKHLPFAGLEPATAGFATVGWPDGRRNTFPPYKKV